MNLKDVRVIEMEISKGPRYADCNATVKLECDGTMCTVIKYPIQDDRHLHMLMKETFSNTDIPHPDKFRILDALNEVIL